MATLSHAAIASLRKEDVSPATPRPLAMSLEASGVATRTLMSDRIHIRDRFSPMHVYVPKLFIINCSMVVTAHLGEMMKKHAPGGEPTDEFEARFEALVAPWVKPSGAARRSGRGGNTNDDSSWNPLNPWPAIFKATGYYCAYEICNHIITWALEEAAICYFSEKFCDELTKQPHRSARRKLERGESRVSAGLEMVPTTIKAQALRYLSSYIADSTIYAFHQVKTWWQDSASKKEETSVESTSTGASRAAAAVAIPWYVYLPSKFYRKAKSLVVEGVICGAITVVLPVGLLSYPKTLFLWSTLVTTGVGVSNMLI